MCAAIGLQIESHNFYRPHFGDAFRHQIDLGADQIGNFKRLFARQKF